MINSVRDTSEVGEVRRAAAGLARSCGLAEEVVGRIALVATEMATNLLKHGGGGVVAMDRFADADGSGLELLALDKGPGMADLARCLADGFSTAGSPGTGLGAVARNSDRYAIYSRPGLGTAVMARFRTRDAASMRAPELGALIAAYPGESVCGDRWVAENGRLGVSLLLVDGSGHGPLAAHAAEIATRTFADNIDKDCVPLVETIHRALAPTRGAALAVARVDADAHVLHRLEEQLHALHLAEVLQMALSPESAPGPFPESAAVRQREAEVRASMKVAGLGLGALAAGGFLLWQFARNR